MWSPKKRKDGAYNHFYDNMKKVEVGDIVFSYFDQKIQFLGVVTHRAVPSPKPETFGTTGEYWNDDGWLVPVSWTKILFPFRPKDYFEDIKPHLPEKYSPLNIKTGAGLQGVYLAHLSDSLAEALLNPLEEFGKDFVQESIATREDPYAIVHTEDSIETSIQNDTHIANTEREAVVKARVGQGKFRTNVEKIEKGCRITGITDRRLLIASHIKPWRSCENNEERINGHNGLLLSPSIDHLFDKGYISFDNNGDLMISETISSDQLEMIGIDTVNEINVGEFNDNQQEFLTYHRDNIFVGKYD